MIRVTTNDTIRGQRAAGAQRPHARQPVGRWCLPDSLHRPARPASLKLRLSWVLAPDGRGLMAAWTDEPQRWQQPAPRRTRRATTRAHG